MTYDMHDEHPMTDVGRQAAHILLDAIAAWDGADPNNFDAPQLAIDRLFEIGAVRVVNHPETGQPTADVSDLLQGATTTMIMIIAALAASVPNGTIHGVIAALRPRIDSLP